MTGKERGAYFTYLVGEGMQPSLNTPPPLSRQEALGQLEKLREHGKKEGWETASAKIVAKRAELLLRQDSFCKEWARMVRNKKKIDSLPSDERSRILVKFSKKWNIRGMDGWMPVLPSPVRVDKVDLQNGNVTLNVDLNLPIRELQKEILQLYGRLHRIWVLSFPERVLKLDEGNYREKSKKERRSIRRDLRRRYDAYLRELQTRDPSSETIERIKSLGYSDYNPCIAPSTYALGLTLADTKRVHGLRISSTETLKKKYLYNKK